MLSNRYFFFKILVICLISSSFFLGYFLRENATGGGLEFYNLSWPIIQSLKKDFFYTIKNYAEFGDGTIPFSHILNAYLNPFSDDVKYFQLSVTVISFITFFVFAKILKRVFSEINFIDILLTASVILLLPFFRTSAFWGKNENYGWLFFMLALYFFFEIKRNISNTPSNRDTLNVIFFCLASACALYARQALIFLPISYFLYLFFNKANKKIIIISIISFTILALPGIFLVITWGSSYNVQDVLLPIGFNESFIHPKYILINIPILLSFFGFYLIPILIIEFLNSGIKSFVDKYLKNFVFALIVFIFLSAMGILNYLANYTLGGGAILKLNYLIQKNNFFLLLIFSSIGFSVLAQLSKEYIKNNLIIIMPIFIIYGIPLFLYQEYVEPLILMMFFLAMKTNLHKIYFKKVSVSNFIFLSYFTIYLIGSIYFKHFAFSSYEEWKIFLNVH